MMTIRPDAAAQHAAVVNAEVHAARSESLDRDRDGIACEMR